MNKKRLLIVHPTIAPYRVDFFNALCERFKTRICSFRKDLQSQRYDNSRIEGKINFTPVYLEKWISLFGRNIYGGLWKQLRTYKPDIVMVIEFRPYMITALAYKWLCRRRLKIVTICDDSYDMVAGRHDFSPLHRISRRLLLPLIDDIILVEPKVVDWYQKHYHKGIYFPIIREESKACAAYERVLPNSGKLVESYDLKEKYVFLYVGRLIKRKNVDTIIKAFSLVRQEDSVLVIVGDGVEMPSLKSMIDMNNVIFTGRMEGDDLYAWYNVGDCFVLASYQEPFGAVTNEALLAGCWCLVSEKAGSQCLIKEGYNGYTFNPHNIEELKEKMELSYQRNRSRNHQETVKNSLMVEKFPELMDHLVNRLYRL